MTDEPLSFKKVLKQCDIVKKKKKIPTPLNVVCWWLTTTQQQQSGSTHGRVVRFVLVWQQLILSDKSKMINILNFDCFTAFLKSSRFLSFGYKNMKKMITNLSQDPSKDTILSKLI